MPPSLPAKASAGPLPNYPDAALNSQSNRLVSQFKRVGMLHGVGNLFVLLVFSASWWRTDDQGGYALMSLL